MRPCGLHSIPGHSLARAAACGRPLLLRGYSARPWASRSTASAAGIRRGDVTLGLGPIAKLPDVGGYFTGHKLRTNRGMGVEIVLEVEDLDAEYARVSATGWPLLDALEDRPWGLSDFRLADPDGYYLRITSYPIETERAPAG